MIVRIWHGIAPECKAGDCADYYLQTGVPDLRAMAGNQVVYLLRNVREGS